VKNFLLLFILLPCLALAQVDKKIIKQQAEQLAAAMVSNDYQTIVNFTYPKVVELLGGRDKMISIIKNGNIEMVKQRITFISSQSLPSRGLCVTFGLEFRESRKWRLCFESSTRTEVNGPDSARQRLRYES
jgi:hypothetical protein